MKKIVFIVLLSISIISCSDNSEKTMNLSGTVKGLKKGTLYLQKTKDTTLVTIDSLRIEGNGDFAFKTEIESPEILYLYLKKEDNNTINDRITFFGEPGNIIINTSWNTFDANAKIEGSASTKKLEEFKKIMSKFNTKSFEYLNAINSPDITKNKTAKDSIIALSNKNNLKSYLYTLNFALNNKDSYATPYIALTEVPDANVKYLDSIHKSLIPEVANSLYGKKLKTHINTIKTK